ncbi:MAG: hypothetical protein ACOCUI_00135 [bacterium]
MNSFLSYEEAKSFVRTLHLYSASEWREYAKTLRPNFIPSHPDRTYKNRGWKNWNEWLGNHNQQGGQRKYAINENFFSEWSHDMAYVYGLWCADGYINKKQWMFSITLHEKDEYLLRNILKTMKSSAPIYKHFHNNKVIRIGSKKIVLDLEFLGAKQCKTHNLVFPNVPKIYLTDFVRGFWDGDGSIYKHKKYNSYFSSCLCASKKFIESLKEHLESNIENFKCNIYLSQKKYYFLCVGVNDTRRLKNFLYSGSCNLFMKRKRELFEKTGEINIASYNKEFLPFEKARLFTRQLGLKNYREWKKYRKTKQKPNDIPATPENIYKNNGWKGYDDWLGNEKWSFEKSKNYVRSLHLKTQSEWVRYAKAERPRNIPSNPWSFYEEWIDLKDWLGKE